MPSEEVEILDRTAHLNEQDEQWQSNYAMNLNKENIKRYSTFCLLEYISLQLSGRLASDALDE